MVSIENIARVSFPRDRAHKKLMLMLEAYFDDSGTHDGSDVIVWGGLLGTEEQWKVLNSAWRKLLKEPLPGKPFLKKFGLADC